MAFKFPFTNYHELNLTWVLEQLKKLFEESNENVETIESYENRLSAVETELPIVADNAQQAVNTANAAGTLAQTAKATADHAEESATESAMEVNFMLGRIVQVEYSQEEVQQQFTALETTVQNFDGRITQAEDDASEALQEAQSFNNRVDAAINTANNAANTATIAQGIADQNAANIGNLADLTTTAKNNLVAAINEAAQSRGSGDNTNCAPIIINTASGFLASFKDGESGGKIRKIIGTIQTAEGALGYTNANIVATGKNLFVANLVQGAINSENGREINNNNRLRSDKFIPLSAGSYTFSTKENCQVMMCLYDANQVYIKPYGSTPGTTKFYGQPATFILNTNYFVRFVVRKSESIRIYPTDISEIQLEIGNNATSYEEKGISKQVNWQTEAGTINNGTVTLNENGSVDVVDSDNEEAYYLPNIGNVITRFGVNAVWIDTGAITECKYPADTKLYIDNKISELQALILEN